MPFHPNPADVGLRAEIVCLHLDVAAEREKRLEAELRAANIRTDVAERERDVAVRERDMARAEAEWWKNRARAQVVELRPEMRPEMGWD